MKDYQSKRKLKPVSTILVNTSLYSIPGLLIILTILCGVVLSAPRGYADTSKTEVSNVSVTVNSACTLKGGSDGTSTSGSNIYTATIDPGTTEEINGSKLVTLCNDPNGYSLYAIGYGNDSYTTPTNTQMIGAGSIGNISTSTTTGGNSSSWAMKLAPVEGVTAPTILNSFNNYHVIPETYTQVTKYTSATSSPTSDGAAIQTKYQVYISSGQAAGTYTGKVKYTVVHPNTATPTIRTIANSTYMQDVESCPASLPTGTTATLIDSRDQQSYIVAKLADGNCWMVQNLKLGKNATSENPLILTPDNSNSGGTFTLGGKLTDGIFHAYTIDGVDYQNNSSEYYCTNNYGCYYNWYTATAGSGTTSVATDGTSVDYSICPKGWTLPTQPQFQTLYNNYNSAALMLVDNPTTAVENTVPKLPGFLLSGLYYSGGASDLGSRGSYWSRTALSAQYGYRLRMDSSSVYTSYYGNKYFGFAVRCVLQQ